MTGFHFFLAVLAVMGAARVAELGLARRYSRRAGERGEAVQPEPIFPFMVLLHTLPFWMGPLEVVVLRRPFLPWLAALSSAALVGAAAVRIWTLITLGQMWNVRLVRPSRVVSTGPYAFVRHPNYAIVIVELLFLPLVHTAVVTAATVTVLDALVLWRRISAEEAMLRSVPGYLEAMGGKPRIVPRLVAARGDRP